MNWKFHRFGRAIGAAAWLAMSVFSFSAGAADGDIKHLGAGSYLTTPPAKAGLPQDTIYQTDSVKGKMPTNDWWSSVAWLKFSDKQYPHPLAVEEMPAGLHVYYPGRSLSAGKDAIFAGMPGGKGVAKDLMLGSSSVNEFEDARVEGFSDWFVTVKFGVKGAPGAGMYVSYGHGSPFVYAVFKDAGMARITFEPDVKVWSGKSNSAVLGVTVAGAHYALFGPTGSTWEGLDGKVFTNNAGGKNYFSMSVLPAADEKTLALFRKYAYNHVVDTKVEWAYDPKAGVTTKFSLATQAREGSGTGAGGSGTLFALYPHQWRHGDAKFTGDVYPSVRGVMKLAEGTSFTTTMPFTGVLPALPKTKDCDEQREIKYLRKELEGRDDGAKDTYWEGKWMGRQATLIPIAEQYGLKEEAGRIGDRLRVRLEDWLAAAGVDGRAKSKRVFYYDEKWGTLIGYPAGYGSDKELNDHHFHYGYFIRAAAEIARRDPAWAADGKFGAMVKLLIRDIAAPSRQDSLFPFLRNFDPYAGHSWAAGHARFADGNNQESSSEALNAWYGIILWGQATGDKALRDLGIYLYTTEMNAVQEYWFDVHEENFPKTFPKTIAAMIWGGKSAYGTWFSAETEAVHGINWLPVHAGSLYLGHFPKHAEKEYQSMLKDRGGDRWKQWQDIIWMFRALTDPIDAMRQFEAAGEKIPNEAGNSPANTYHWIAALKTLGHVNPTVTADWPMAAVFDKGGMRTHVAYAGTGDEVTVRFSDGATIKLKGAGFGILQVGETAGGDDGKPLPAATKP